MRILLDESLPRQLARELRGHDVRTVNQEKWTGLKNGELLRRAKDKGFEVFITADQNLEYQQNLAKSGHRQSGEKPDGRAESSNSFHSSGVIIHPSRSGSKGP